MIYSFVPFHEVMAEYMLNSAHYFEGISDKTEDYALDVDWDYYAQLSQLGQCFIAMLSDENGIMQAHAVYAIGNNPRHKQILTASADAVFAEEEYRGIEVSNLLKKAEDSLRVLGVHEVNYTWSDPRQGKLLEVHGYKPTHTVFSKNIGEDYGQ